MKLKHIETFKNIGSLNIPHNNFVICVSSYYLVMTQLVYKNIKIGTSYQTMLRIL